MRGLVSAANSRGARSRTGEYKKRMALSQKKSSSHTLCDERSMYWCAVGLPAIAAFFFFFFGRRHRQDQTDESQNFLGVELVFQELVVHFSEVCVRVADQSKVAPLHTPQTCGAG